MSTIDGYHLVSVRAVPRPGFDGFNRGGQRWPESPPRIVLVTNALLGVLLAETMLAVDRGVDPGEVDLEKVERLDVPKRTYLDVARQPVEEAKRMKAELEELRALASIEDMAEEIAHLKGRIADKAKRAEADAARAAEEAAFQQELEAEATAATGGKRGKRGKIEE